MKINSFLLILLFILMSSVTSSSQAKEKAKHVIFIGLDGWGAYSVPKADMPVVKQMMADGCYTLKKRTALPSSSAIN